MFGCPVGTEQYRTEFAVETITKLQTVDSRALACLHPRTQLQIINQVINSQPVYLTRALDLPYTQGALSQFNNYVSELWAATLEDRADRDLFQTLRGLPLRHGGMGVMLHGGCQTLQGLASAHARTRAYVRTPLPYLLRRITTTSTLPYGDFEKVGHGNVLTEVSESAEIEPANLDGMDVKEVASIARAITTHIHKRQVEGIIATLSVDTSDSSFGSQLAYFRSNQGAKEAARFFTFSFARTNISSFFPGPAFIEAARARMLAPQRNAAGQPARSCAACGTRAVVLRHGQRPKEPLHAHHWAHALSCTQCMGTLQTGRHNQICKALATLLKRCRPAGDSEEAGGVAVTLEERCIDAPMIDTGRAAVPGSTDMDVVMRWPDGRVVFVDVAVADPGCITYMNYNADSSLVNAEAAARIREADKRADFDLRLNKVGAQPIAGCCIENFVPFVLEANGRLGPSARALLDSLLPFVSSDAVRQHAAIICARDLGRAILLSRGITAVRGRSGRRL